MSDAPARARGAGGPQLLEGLVVQSRVIGALMIRDALSRYGHHGFGFFWVIGEPLLLTSGIMILWSATHMTHGSDVGVIPFALTSYSFVTLWRHIVAKSIRVLSQSSLLAYHRQIKPLDIVIARSLLELVSVIAAFMIAFLPLCLLGFCPNMQDPLLLIGGFVLTAAFSFGFGLVLAAITELNETAHHLIGPIMYITMPFTGIFFMVDWLPDNLQKIMMWSPLVNGIEMIRCGLFPAGVATHFDVAYLTYSSLGLISLGIFLCHHAAKRVQN